MLIRLKPFVRGLLSFLPGSKFLLPRRKVGSATDPRSCYFIWLKHLCLAWRAGWTTMPQTLVELGPGDSLGVGFAALISGVNAYVGLDTARFADTKDSLPLFDSLVDLYKNRTGRTETDWPDYDDFLDERRFPHQILSEKRLAACLAQERIAHIREQIAALANGRDDTDMVRYIASWHNADVVSENWADMILSHAVLEHVNDLDHTFACFRRWLKPGGLMSHDIDLRCHGLSTAWNGHWAIREWMWRLIAGRRTFLLNRRPCSTYEALARRYGFETAGLYRQALPGIDRARLAPRWKNLSDQDLSCSEVVLLATKP